MALGRGGPTEKETIGGVPRGAQGPLNFSIDRILAPDFGRRSCLTGLNQLGKADGGKFYRSASRPDTDVSRRKSFDFGEVFRLNHLPSFLDEKPGINSQIRSASSSPDDHSWKRHVDPDFWSPRKLLPFEDGRKFRKDSDDGNFLKLSTSTSPFGGLQNFKSNWPNINGCNTYPTIQNNPPSDLNFDLFLKLHLSNRKSENVSPSEDNTIVKKSTKEVQDVLSDMVDKTPSNSQQLSSPNFESRFPDRKDKELQPKNQEMLCTSDTNSKVTSKRRRLTSEVNHKNKTERQSHVASDSKSKLADVKVVDEADNPTVLEEDDRTTLQDDGSADGKNLRWPIWVYVTRFSARPSSGPRSRRQKRPCSTPTDEKRARTAFTSSQLARLRQEFQTNRYLTEQSRIALAAELKLSESQVKIWFQNKRAKVKRTADRKNPLALQLMAQGLYNHRQNKH